jgi:predicted  nucleic acid-binding Zn-ribbon protein
MDEKPSQDLATRAFHKRVLDEFAAVRAEQAAMRADQAEMRTELAAIRTEQAEMRAELAAMRAEQAQMRTDITEMRSQQLAMAGNVAAPDQRLTTIEGCFTAGETNVDEHLKEIRPIWETVQMQIQRMMEKLDGALLEFHQMRDDLRIHGLRLSELERHV